MLGVMKAGGACVALGAAHPISRLNAILDEVQATVILVAPQHAHKFQGKVKHIITIQPSLFEGGLQISRSINLPKVLPNNVAFVLYTSGTTGKPKGIVIEHASFCTSSHAFADRWNLKGNSRVIQFASYTFDVSVSDQFTTLLRGGCICIPSEEERMNNLSGAIDRMNVNWASLTATVANLLQPEDIPSLRTLVLGGEASTRNIVDKWAPALDLIIAYGPAECSINCLGAEPARLENNPDPADLGYAIGCRLWITDTYDHNRLAPIGCVGSF